MNTISYTEQEKLRTGTGAVKITDDVRHAGLVAHSGSEVDGLLRVILGEAKGDN